MNSNSTERRESLLRLLKLTTGFKRHPGVAELIIIPILGQWQKSGLIEKIFENGNVPLFNPEQCNIPQVDIDAAILTLISSDNGTSNEQTYVFPASVPGKSKSGQLDCFLLYESSMWYLCEKNPHTENKNVTKEVGIENVLPTLLDLQIDLEKMKLVTLLSLM